MLFFPSEKSERGEQGILREHQADLDELRKELIERDERIEELQLEIKTQVEVNKLSSYASR